MTAVRACWASQLRARGRAWLSLALLLGLAGGVALAAAAQRPADRTALLLALLLGLVAVATLAHTLLTSIRRRRRDLAVLKTLGFVRRQVAATVASQATALVGLALVMGVPLGVVLGRWAWVLFARQLGVLPEPTLSAVIVAATVPAALLAANLVATVPARTAARTRPALVLRSE